jgi:hypothetical protein
MTTRRFLARSLDTAALLCGLSGCVMVFAPRAFQTWESRLARQAAAACERHGGTALFGEDRVVSCLPAAFAQGGLP